MNKKLNKNKPLSEQEIDRLVTRQSDDDSAWGKPIEVKRGKHTSLNISANLAARAAFLARLHHGQSVEEWLTQVIEERVHMEEAAFARIKQDMAAS